jgi:hypothetical protein
VNTPRSKTAHGVSSSGGRLRCRIIDPFCGNAIVRDNPNNCWAHAVLDLAGPLGEQRYANYPEAMLAMMWRSAWKVDHANAKRHLSELEGAVVSLTAATNMARHLVDEHWDAITRVAQALAWEGELSRTALDRLWREQDALAS